MFDIGWSELLVVGVVALVVVGPKELPGLLRSLGRAMSTVRRMAGEFQGQFNEAMREAELDELRKEVGALRSTAASFLKVPDVPSIMRDEVKSAIQGTAPVAPSAVASASASELGPDFSGAGALEVPGAGTQAPDPALPAPVPGSPVEAALHYGSSPEVLPPVEPAETPAPVETAPLRPDAAVPPPGKPALS